MSREEEDRDERAGCDRVFMGPPVSQEPTASCPCVAFVFLNFSCGSGISVLLTGKQRVASD